MTITNFPGDCKITVSEVNHNFKTQKMEKQEKLDDYESIKQQALEQFRSGKSLTGKGGAFAWMLS